MIVLHVVVKGVIVCVVCIGYKIVSLVSGAQNDVDQKAIE